MKIFHSPFIPKATCCRAVHGFLILGIGLLASFSVSAKGTITLKPTGLGCYQTKPIDPGPYTTTDGSGTIVSPPVVAFEIPTYRCLYENDAGVRSSDYVNNWSSAVFGIEVINVKSIH